MKSIYCYTKSIISLILYCQHLQRSIYRVNAYHAPLPYYQHTSEGKGIALTIFIMLHTFYLGKSRTFV